METIFDNKKKMNSIQMVRLFQFYFVFFFFCLSTHSDRQGCKKVVTIEHIQDHRDRCEFKPTVPMVCDTGYNNIHVQSNNTFVNEPTKMEKCDVKASHISRQQSPSQLEDVMHKVSGELLETEILESNQTSVNQPKWQQLCNLKINTDDILEVETESFYAFAQSACAMDPTTTESSFKIQLLTFDYFKYMAIGFTCKGHQTDKIPGLDDESIGCDSSGDLIMDKKSKKVGEQWKAGDVIECGIKFPCNLSNNGERDDVDDVQVKIYFCRNGQLIADTKMLMPKNGYFPTIYMFEGVMGGWWNNGEMCDVTGTNTKVKYFN